MKSASGTSPGRPRGFDADVALSAARDLFWTCGYDQTSLDDLIDAMGISRSSFYACFGSKHQVLQQALSRHAEACRLAMVQAMTAATPQERLLQGLLTLADLPSGRRGCFLANSLVEFGGRDPEIETILQDHLAQVTDCLARTLAEAGQARPHILADHLLALVLGAIALRKAGRSAGDLESMLRSGLAAALTPITLA